MVRLDRFHISCDWQNAQLALLDIPFGLQVLFEARGYTDNLSSGIKTLSSRPDGEKTAQASLLNPFEPALLQQVRIYLKHKRNSELFACPCSAQGQQVKSFMNQIIPLQVNSCGLRHSVTIEQGQVGELQF